MLLSNPQNNFRVKVNGGKCRRRGITKSDGISRASSQGFFILYEVLVPRKDPGSMKRKLAFKLKFKAPSKACHYFSLSSMFPRQHRIIPTQTITSRRYHTSSVCTTATCIPAQPPSRAPMKTNKVSHENTACTLHVNWPPNLRSARTADPCSVFPTHASTPRSTGASCRPRRGRGWWAGRAAVEGSEPGATAERTHQLFYNPLLYACCSWPPAGGTRSGEVSCIMEGRRKSGYSLCAVCACLFVCVHVCVGLCMCVSVQHYSVCVCVCVHALGLCMYVCV